MDIALLGGTSDVGEGLALRWAYDTNHRIVVGSSRPRRAREKAEEYVTELDSRGVEATIVGVENADAATRADSVVVAVPYAQFTDTVEAVVTELDAGDVVVSPVVSVTHDEDGTHYDRPPAGSVTAQAADATPRDVAVVGAFHNLAADRLANLDIELDMDTPVIGDDEDAVETVSMLVEGIAGLRALPAGPIANAAEVEALAPLLGNLETYNHDMFDVSVRFH
jgi:NADPH-dependent F420 reductase